MDVSELRQLFLQETKVFLEALDSGAPTSELEAIRNKLKELSMYIDNKTRGGSLSQATG